MLYGHMGFMICMRSPHYRILQFVTVLRIFLKMLSGRHIQICRSEEYICYNIIVCMYVLLTSDKRLVTL